MMGMKVGVPVGGSLCYGCMEALEGDYEAYRVGVPSDRSDVIWFYCHGRCAQRALRAAIHLRDRHDKMQGTILAAIQDIEKQTS